MKVRVRLNSYERNWGYLGLGALGGATLGAVLYLGAALLAWIRGGWHG